MTYGLPQEGKTVNANYTATAGTTVAITARAVRVFATTACFIRISTAGTSAVAATDMPMEARSYEVFTLPELGRISAIRETTDGTIYVTPMG